MPSRWRLSSTVLFFILHLWDPKKCSALLASRAKVLPGSLHLKKAHSSSSSLSSFTSSTKLCVSSGFLYPEEEPVQKVIAKPVMEPPLTETLFERPKTAPKSLPPKVIVLGASGRIGRRVIRQLMALESDITVVAFVRDYERACEVLYDELLIEMNAKGPTLQLVVMDLVPKSYVAGYKPKVDEDEDDEEYSVSASRFYKNDVEDYDFRTSTVDDSFDLHPYLPLKDAITNATAVISTIGTVRSTIPFADYLLKPWRIFLSPRIWCADASHPYYVNYMVHKKVLEYCEEAQRSRNREWRVWQNNEKRRDAKSAENGEKNEHENETENVEKIRIVRITDHCLANPAWDLVNVMTNIVRSMVFRYQAKCEMLLSSSNLVDTIVLRPGDLVDDKRNETTTTMSISVDGKLPGPVNVGRDDVATLATLAAISDLHPPVKKEREIHSADGRTITNQILKHREQPRQKMGDSKPRHWKIAVGWAGENGIGYKNADKCMEYIVKEHGRRRKSKRRKHAILNANPVSRLFVQPYQRTVQKTRERTLKPYRLFVFLPMFMFVYPTILSVLVTIGKQFPAVQNAALYILAVTEPLRHSIVEYCQEFLKKQVIRSAGIKNKAVGLLIE